MYTTALKGFSSGQYDGAYVEILGTDPAQTGHGYGAGLLEWQIEQHRRSHPHVAIFLDTNSDYAQKVYEKLGFVEINRGTLSAKIDKHGCKFQSPDSEAENQATGDTHTFRVMMLSFTSS